MVYVGAFMYMLQNPQFATEISVALTKHTLADVESLHLAVHKCSVNMRAYDPTMQVK